jgi:thymidylate kinase
VTVSIALEGLEGAGKSTVADALCLTLSKLGCASQVVPEFSDSSLGSFLLKRLEKDRFLRDPVVPQTAYTQLYSVAADTAHALEYAVPGLLAEGTCAIKDRYRESVVACQSLSLSRECGLSEQTAYATALSVASHLPDPVQWLFWLDVPLVERVRRLRERGDYEVRDRSIYEFRERQYRRLMMDPAWGWRAVLIDGSGSVSQTVVRIMQSLRAQNGIEWQVDAYPICWLFRG